MSSSSATTENQPPSRMSASDMIKNVTDFMPEVIPPLKLWLQENPHFPSTSDELLIVFAHSCYYDLEKTKNCIENYYTIHSNSPEFFMRTDLDLPEMQTALSVLDFACLPKKTPEGYQIVLNRLSEYEPSKLVFPDAVKLLNMTMETAVYLDGPQAGYYFVFDMTGARIGHISRMSISHLRKVLLFVQEANPIRLKGIHVINTLPLLDKIMMLIKPFMKKELLKLLHFYAPAQLQDLYKFIPKDCLPCDYGGTLKSFTELHADNTERMARLKLYWKEQESMVINESLRPSKKGKKKQNLKDATPDIRRLDLD